MNRATLHTNWAGSEWRTSPVGQDVRDPITEADRAAWIFVRDAGGYWTWRDAARELGVPLARGPNPLVRLFNRCHVARRMLRTAAGERYCYGVTAQCDPIAGETLAPSAARVPS